MCGFAGLFQRPGAGESELLHWAEVMAETRGELAGMGVAADMALTRRIICKVLAFEPVVRRCRCRSCI